MRGQGVHALIPATCVIVSTGHKLQARAPAVAYLPAAQMSQSPLTFITAPALHLMQDGIPGRLASSPAGHAEQLELPAGEYVPAEHEVEQLLVAPEVAP